MQFQLGSKTTHNSASKMKAIKLNNNASHQSLQLTLIA